MLYTLSEQQCRNLEVSSKREWVLPNGIGGYAMGTASGINTRRYHGHLVAATHPPTGRMVLLAALDAMVQASGNAIGLSANQYPGTVFPEGYHYLKSFSVGKTATWTFKSAGIEVEKRLGVHPGVNAVTVRYKNTGKQAFFLTLRPLISHRDHHGNFTERGDYPSRLAFPPTATLVEDCGVPLYISHPEAVRTPVQGWYYRFEHARELERGLSHRDDLFCPCELRYELLPGQEAVLVASVGEELAPIDFEPEQPATFKVGEMLTEAAGKFFVQTEDRSSTIAGFPWFTDWGRDTMISMPGLCVHTGRIAEAKKILHDYAGQMHQGLIPNRFVESGEKPDYNTVDATLWFANAIYKVLATEWDEKFAKEMLAKLHEVFEWHMKGTLFGIKVDPTDGLLTQGESGLQLTWMDAKVNDWVVTPRHGKPVEINGLWINALRVMAWLATKITKPKFKPEVYQEAADKAAANFEKKFWHEVRGHYLDTVDPTDASLRPNQVLAMALPFSPVDPEHAKRALGVVGRELLTLKGLRTLGPEEPGYHGRFRGSLPELDAAYHQGTVWPWLMGSYVTALVRYTGDRQEGKRILREAKSMLAECGLGGIAEVYDGDGPQEPGGCPWQAWSVAEFLRAWVEDIGGD